MCHFPPWRFLILRRTDVEIPVESGQFSIKWFPLESMFMEQNLQVKALTGLDNRNQRTWKDVKGKIAENYIMIAYGGVCGGIAQG